MSGRKAKRNSWGNVMDSLYEESWEEDADELHSGISPHHFRLDRHDDDDTIVEFDKRSKLRRVLSRPNLKRVFSLKRMSGGQRRSGSSPSSFNSAAKPAQASRSLSVRNFVVSHEMVVESVTGGRKKLSNKVLQRLETVDAAGIARNYVFDPEIWKESWLHATTMLGWEKLRKIVLEGTLEASMEGFYWVAAGPESRKGAPKRIPLFVATHTREYAQMIDYGPRRIPMNTELRVFNYKTTAHFIYADVVDVAVFLKNEKNTDPLTLVFGHYGELGDGMRGSFSQEESVLMRTNLVDLINNPKRVKINRDWTYSDIPEYGGCYVPHASVIRSNESTGFKFLQKPIKLAFLLADGVNNQFEDRPNESKSYRRTWQRKVECVLQCALEKGHDSLVLGAWGCGYMENDVEQIARFMKVAVTKKFRGCFKHVVFSFLRDPEAYVAFSKAFGAREMPYPTRERSVVDRNVRLREDTSGSTSDESSSEDIIFYE